MHGPINTKKHLFMRKTDCECATVWNCVPRICRCQNTYLSTKYFKNGNEKEQLKVQKF